MSMTKTKILLVDDHELVRAGFRRLLEDGDKFEVVCESGSGEQAVQDFNKHHPDVVVMDISMPGIGGVGAIERIIAREQCSCKKIVSHKKAPHRNAGLMVTISGRQRHVKLFARWLPADLSDHPEPQK